tara:strand:- start:156 stop:1304 length:1149 start_codon:yes stop_codon:yes gene_type:complete
LDVVPTFKLFGKQFFNNAGFSGDALIMMKEMNYDLTDKDILNLIILDKKKIQKKYNDLKENKHQIFDATELKKEFFKDSIEINEKKLKNNEELSRNLPKEKNVISENKDDIFFKLRKLQMQISNLSNIEIKEVYSFKKLVIENENDIIEKGGDQKLFEFLKIDVFLNDFRNKILDDIKDILNLDFSDIEYLIAEEDRFKNGKISVLDCIKWAGDPQNDLLASMSYNAKKIELIAEGKSLQVRLISLYCSGDSLKSSIDNLIIKLNIYETYAISNLVFYMNNNMIQYFEIYSAFEKLGVFDSSWQKSVKSKIISIDEKLSLIGTQLTNLNAEFSKLLESSQNLLENLNIGLQKIESSIDANIVFSAITAYQTFRLNKSSGGSR